MLAHLKMSSWIRNRIRSDDGQTNGQTDRQTDRQNFHSCKGPSKKLSNFYMSAEIPIVFIDMKVVTLGKSKAGLIFPKVQKNYEQGKGIRLSGVYLMFASLEKSQCALGKWFVLTIQYNVSAIRVAIRTWWERLRQKGRLAPAGSIYSRNMAGNMVC